MSLRGQELSLTAQTKEDAEALVELSVGWARSNQDQLGDDALVSPRFHQAIKADLQLESLRLQLVRTKLQQLKLPQGAFSRSRARACLSRGCSD